MSADKVTSSRFLEILMERKSDRRKRAERRRQEDQERIASFKCKNESGIDPLHLFPYEVWEPILDRLVDPKDLENARDSCPLFREILKSRELYGILFPQVLKVKAFNKRFQQNDFLVLRLVCKSWRNVIDLWHRQGKVEEKLQYHSEEGWGIPRMRKFELGYSWPRDIKTLQELESNFRAKAKRFIPGTLMVIADNFGKESYLENNIIPFKVPFTEALGHVGNQIWNFTFSLGDTKDGKNTGINLNQVYATLVEWLTLMPNLECFKISLTCSPLSRDWGFDDVIKTNPFPEMKKLKRLHISTTSSVLKVAEAILLSNTHVDSLIFDGHLLLEGKVFPRLTLHPTSFHLTRSARLPTLPFKWPLRQLKLELSLKTLYISTLFQILENFQTLEKLSLELYDVPIIQNRLCPTDKELLFLHLPNLKDYTFFNALFAQKCAKGVETDPNYVISIDYLIHCRKLERLSWWNPSLLKVFSLEQVLANEGLIDFKGGYANFDESNIWSVFPLLETVKLRDPCCRTFCKPREQLILNQF